MREGRPGGEPGSLLWDSMSPEPLQRALAAAAAIDAAGEDDSWALVLSVARCVLDVRTQLRSEVAQQSAQYPLSLDMIESFSRETEAAQAGAPVSLS